jgi:hypothetical protein
MLFLLMRSRLVSVNYLVEVSEESIGQPLAVKNHLKS